MVNYEKPIELQILLPFNRINFLESIKFIFLTIEKLCKDENSVHYIKYETHFISIFNLNSELIPKFIGD